MPITEYLAALFRELERLWPVAAWAPAGHGMAWSKEGLVMLFNVGDCVFPYLLKPGDISDDPVDTAAHLAAIGHGESLKPDADSRIIGFKR